jgi:hypothetical protein
MIKESKEELSEDTTFDESQKLLGVLLDDLWTSLRPPYDLSSLKALLPRLALPHKHEFLFFLMYSSHHRGSVFQGILAAYLNHL